MFSGKTDTAPNITIHKMTEMIESTTILEVNDDKGVIHLLRNKMHSDSDISQLPLSKCATFHEPCLLLNQYQRPPLKERGCHRPLSITRK